MTRVSTFSDENHRACGPPDLIEIRAFRPGRAEERSPVRKRWEDCQNRTSPERGERGMSHSFTSLFVHIVFSTKDRAPELTPELSGRLFAYMDGIIVGIRLPPRSGASRRSATSPKACALG